MAYVIADGCAGHKTADCVTICPVDCIHPTPDEPGYGETDQLFIDPGTCTDCDACVNECPWGAIYPGDELPASLAGYARRNAAFFASSPER